MKIDLIPSQGNFYKVNMHCHTNISDGKRSPEEIKEFYKSAGYSAICYTDHEILIGHKELCDDDFIALHGYEVAIKKDLSGHTAYHMPVYHFNFIAKSQDNMKMPKYFVNNPSFPGASKSWSEKYAQYDETIETTRYDKEWINEYLKAVSDGGFLVNYNHPEWSLQNATDYIGLENIHSVEIANGGCLAMNDNTSVHFNQMLRAGMKVVPTGGDDNHNAGGSLRCWTVIKAPRLTYEDLIAGYENGDCYASESPEIKALWYEDGKIKAETSPAARIYLRSEGRYAPTKTGSDLITYAEFEYSPAKMGRFFRIEVRDAAGFRAWSNAYYVDDVESRIASEEKR